MSNETKKYAGLEALQTFLDGCKTLFATITHKHKLEDITDYVVDSELNSESMNPIQNSTVKAELDYIKDAKADWNQNNENAIDYIKNRTHYAYSNTTKIALGDEYTGEFDTTAWNDIPDFGLDQTDLHDFIEVVWDNKPYKCNIIYGEVGTKFQTYAIGDENLVKYPFYIFYQKANDFIDFFEEYSYAIASEAGTHTICMYAVTEEATLKQLNEKFIPDTIARQEYVDANFALKSDIENIDLSDYETKADAQLKYDEFTSHNHSWGDIKDKPFDYTPVSEIYTYDGNPEGKEINDGAVKVSSDIPLSLLYCKVDGYKLMIYADGEITESNCILLEQESEEVGKIYSIMASDDGELSALPLGVIVMSGDNKGLYLADYRELGWQLYVTSLTCPTVEIETIRENVLPDTLARKDYVHENFALKSDIKDVDLSAYETKEDAQLKYDILKDAKADWNQNNENAIDYIKNRTHGEALAESEVIVFNNKLVDFMQEPMMPNVSSSFAESSNSDLVVGQTYTVVWDGTTYENLVCFEDDNAGYKSLGSAENILGETGAYPFFIQNIYDTELLFATSDTSIFEHTIQVSTISTVVTVKQLDEKFIPDTIARTNYVNENFALKSEIGGADLSNYYTKEDVDNMEFITVDDIDTICGTNIQIANEVMF